MLFEYLSHSLELSMMCWVIIREVESLRLVIEDGIGHAFEFGLWLSIREIENLTICIACRNCDPQGLGLHGMWRAERESSAHFACVCALSKTNTCLSFGYFCCKMSIAHVAC